MKNTSDGSDISKTSQENQSEAREGSNEGQGFLGGIGDAISGIFNSARDMIGQPSASAEQAAPDTSDTSSKSAPDSGDSSSGSTASSGSGGIFADPNRSIFGGYGESGSATAAADQSQSGSASGENASQESASSTGGSDVTGRDASAEEEPFVGSGGVGSPEFYENLRRAHEAAGGEYTSDLGDPNRAS